MPDRVNLSTFLPLTHVSFEILLTLAGGEQHGYAIMLEVEARTGGAVNLHAGSLYRALNRLLEAGLIVELDERPGPDGRRRAATLLRVDAKGPRGRPRRSAAARSPRRHGPSASSSACEPDVNAERTYAALLVAFPRRFRTRYGEGIARGDSASSTAAPRIADGSRASSFLLQTALDGALERNARADVGRSPLD